MFYQLVGLLELIPLLLIIVVDADDDAADAEDEEEEDDDDDIQKRKNPDCVFKLSKLLSFEYNPQISTLSDINTYLLSYSLKCR